MFISKVNPKKPETKAIAAAVEALRDGGLVIFPTETAYGIACDATNTTAVKRLFKAKNRDISKTLPVIVSSHAMARKYGAFNALSKGLAKAFWPGPLTVIVPAVPGMPKGIVSKDDEIAMRVSSHRVASALARRLGKPIAATSANPSGKPEKYSVEKVLGGFGVAFDVVLDGGKLKKRKPSTVVRCGDEICEILREGPVEIPALVRALKKCPR